MSEILTQLPNTFLGWGAILTLIFAGAFSLYGIFDKTRNDRRRSTDMEDDRLINLLQGTVSELEKTVKKQTEDIVHLTEKFNKMSYENETLMKVLQGRDEKTQEFYTKGFAAMETANKILVVVENVDKELKEKNNSVAKLIDAMTENSKMIIEAAKLRPA